MAIRHMNEDEIQAFLEKGTSALDQVFEAHLAECRECRARVEEYREVFEGAAADPGFELSAGFTEMVLARVHEEAAEAARRRWQNWLLGLAGAAMVVLGMGFFMDLGPLWQALRGVFAPSIQQGALALDQAGRQITSSGNTLLMLLFCVLILGAVAGADHLLFRSRQSKFCL